MIGEKNQAVLRFWAASRERCGIEGDDFHVSTFADPRYLDRHDPLLDLSAHAELVASGRKQGTAHLLLDFAINGIPQRQVGDYWIVPDFDGEPLFLLRVVDVLVTPFEQVPESFARREGEGDLTLAWWKDAHRAYFTRQCAHWGIAWTEQLLTVCESFTLITQHP